MRPHVRPGVSAGPDRRRFLSTVLGTAALAAAGAPFGGRAAAQGRVARQGGTRVRLGLNLYSFNEPLRAGTLTLDDVVDYCAQQGIDELDATGYYFPGYPAVPDAAFLHQLKRRAFVNGVTIGGTGVRNDFAVTDAAARRRDVEMVKAWIEAAARLGATVVRIFAGQKVPDGGTFDRTLAWMVPGHQGMCRPRPAARRHRRAAESQRLPQDRRRDDPRHRGRELRVVRRHPRCGEPSPGRSLRRDREARAVRGDLAAQGERLVRPEGSPDRFWAASRPSSTGAATGASCPSRPSGRAIRA